MRPLFYLSVVIALTCISVSGEQQRILRRVIKSAPLAANLGRVRVVAVRSPTAENGAVAEISSKEAANFGQRSSNETSTSSSSSSTSSKTQQVLLSPVAIATTKSKTSPSTPNTNTSTAAAPTTSAPSSSLTSSTTTTTTSKPELKHKVSERQQASSSANEVEVIQHSPSSWQMLTAVEAPAAMLIATGTRPAIAVSNDLASSSSNQHFAGESSSGDFLRASSTKGASSYTQQQQQSVSEAFSRIRQQQTSGKTTQAYFYPQQQQLRSSGKTSNYQAGTKTHWYQAPATTTTTPRPAPIVQEPQYEQYVEQQQQEYASAPLGLAEPFAFDFKTEDNSGNGQYRKEESDKNGVVRGSYGYTDASGIYRHVEYVADENGFRANIKSNEPGLIGETQPASIQMAGGPSPSQGSNNQRLSASSNVNDNGEWVESAISSQSGNLAQASPDFESSHKSDRLRSPRHHRL